MLEHVPAFLGRSLKGVRAGHAKLVAAKPSASPRASSDDFTLTSPAFEPGETLPARFTADAEGDAVSPPLAWTDPPAGTKSLVLVVEDADAPSPEPLVHWLAWDLSGQGGHLAEAASPPSTGRNSYQRQAWLPPDPPSGHSAHDYVFQLFALDVPAELEAGSGRTAVEDRLDGHVLAVAVLQASYARPG